MTSVSATLRPDAAQPASRGPTAKFNSALFSLVFISYYLELSIYSNDDLVFPFFLTTLTAFIGVAANFWAVRRAHVTILSVIIAAIWTFTILTYVIVERDFARVVLSTVQITVSIMTAYAIFIVIGLSDRRWTSIVLISFAVIILVGSIAESLGPVRDASNAVRSLIYPKSLIYDADRRDLLQYGITRPTFFTREPSLVGINLGYCFCLGILLTNFRPTLKTAMLVLTGLLSFYFVRSPANIMFVAIGLYAQFMVTSRARNSIVFANWTGIVVIALLALLAPLVVAIGAGLNIDARYYLGGGSYFIRIFGPPMVFMESMEIHPFFGFGLGSFEQLLPVVRKVYLEAGAYSLFPFFRTAADASVLMSNAFWEFWIMFGLFGGAVLVWLFSKFWHQLGIRVVIFPFVALALSLQTFGGISAFRPWFFLFSFAALEFLMRRPFGDARSSSSTTAER